MAEKMAPIHPGEILSEDFLKDLGISQYRLARDINVDPRRINAIVQGKRNISVDTALRLARYFGTTAQFWLNAQMHYDLEAGRDELEGTIEKDVKPLVDPQTQ
jgi:addiction module HigA family antidote